MPKALICKAAGDWREVLELREVAFPEKPAAGFVRVRMLAAAVHPSDFGMIAGTYGKAKPFPCVMGREGVGEVVSIAGVASSVKPGDRVRIPEELGAWQEEVDVPAEELFPLPKDLAPEQLALSFINPPTALRVLEDFVTLRPGDLVITNAGKSAVSVAFLQLAKASGLKAHAVIRNKTPEDEAWLKGLGAEAVWDEGEEYFKSVKARLVLNQVGGESVLRLVKALASQGVCVTIGGAARETVRYPTRELIFNDVQLRGFWFDQWTRTHSPSEVLELFAKVWLLMSAGKLTQEVSATFPLSDFTAALASAAAPGRRGKVLLTS